MNKTLKYAGVAFAMASMTYLVTMLLWKTIPLNLASFGLWLLIDVALVAAMLRARKEGDTDLPWLMIAYTIGTAVIVAILVYNFSSGKSVFAWEEKETWTVAAVAIAMIVWYMTNDKWGVIMSTNAMLIATIPTWADALHDPANTDLVFWLLSGTGCLLTIFGSQKTLVDRYMPIAGTFSNFLVVLLSLKQFL